MAPQYVIVGLGNPGKEYEGTRHNVGFEVVDAYHRRLFIEYGAVRVSGWSNLQRLAEVASYRIDDLREVLLAKPTTYMNESGKAVAALVKKLQIQDSKFQILVTHDDLDLPLGTLRLSQGGSSGGHKGVQSIIDALTVTHTPTRSPSFLRLRIGIGPNATPDGHRIPSEKFVLEKFRREERPLIDAAIQRAVEAIEVFLRDGLAAAQQSIHR